MLTTDASNKLLLDAALQAAKSKTILDTERPRLFCAAAFYVAEGISMERRMLARSVSSTTAPAMCLGGMTTS